MQSPKNFYKAIARTLTINKTPASSATNNAITNNNNNNTASANQNEHDSEQHLFETNRIEDIQATSILRSLMQSYSMQSMSNKNHTNNLGDVVMTSEDDNDDHDDEDHEIRSIGAGSCTNYVDFDEHDEYEADHDGVDENNDTFLVNIDDGECPNQDQQLTFLNLAANRNPSELQPDLIHNRKRKINESSHQMY